MSELRLHDITYITKDEINNANSNKSKFVRGIPLPSDSEEGWYLTHQPYAKVANVFLTETLIWDLYCEAMKENFCHPEKSAFCHMLLKALDELLESREKRRSEWPLCEILKVLEDKGAREAAETTNTSKYEVTEGMTLKEWCKANSVTMNAVAKMSGITVCTLSRINAGKQKASSKTIRKIMTVTGLGPNCLSSDL